MNWRVRKIPRAAWTRREWLQAAAGAAGVAVPEWQIAFRLNAGSVFVLDAGVAGSGAGAALTPDPPHPDYRASLQAGEPAGEVRYDLLTGRFGLLTAVACQRMACRSCTPEGGWILQVRGRDRARFSQLRERIFLSRPVTRGPQVWNTTLPVRRPKLSSLERTQIGILLEHEHRVRFPHRRTAGRKTIWWLQGEGASRLLLAQGVWQGGREARAVSGTVAGVEALHLDSIRAGTPPQMPEPLDTFSWGEALLLVVRAAQGAEAVYELWRRETGLWRAEAARTVFRPVR
jgi:hypothetical protein